MSGKRWFGVIVLGLLCVGIVVLARKRAGTEPGRDASSNFEQSAGLKERSGAGLKEQSAGLEEIKTATGIEMVLLPGGALMMGDKDGDDNAKYVHKVRVSSFYIDKYELSQESFYDLMGINTSKVLGEKNPVERVTWLMAAKYCNRRSIEEDLKPCYDEDTWKCDFEADGYRLPTEAEWEYACRAGTDTTYSFGNNAQTLKSNGWFKGNSDAKPHPVGGKPPNPWGLCDMHGNVWEWCNDRYEAGYYKAGPEEDPRGPESGEERVLRGGSWRVDAEKCASAYRLSDNPATEDICQGRPDYGFRCVRSAPAGK